MATSSFDDTLGALLVSTMIGYFALGILLSAGVHYFTTYPKDPLWFKATVTWVLLIAIMNAGCVYPTWIYDWAVTHYGDLSVQAVIPSAFIVSTLSIAIVVLTVHGFFSWRIWVLNGSDLSVHSLTIPVAIMTLSLAQFASLFRVVIGMIKDRSLADFPKIYKFGIIWGALSCVADLLVTFTLMYKLIYKQRKSPVASTSQHIFRKITYQAVENNLLSLIIQIIVVVLLAINKGFWFSIADGSAVQIYAYSLLASLNSRTRRSDASSDDQWNSSNGNDRTKRAGFGTQGVTVDQERRIQGLEEWRTGGPLGSQVNVRFDSTVPASLKNREKAEQHELDSL